MTSSCTNPVAQVDFDFYQGDDYEHSFIWQDSQGNPIDLTGYTARLQVRETADSEVIILEVDETSGIGLGGASGTVDLKIPGTETAKVLVQSVYDLELTSPGGEVRTLVRGAVCVHQEVTR